MERGVGVPVEEKCETSSGESSNFAVFSHSGRYQIDWDWEKCYSGSLSEGQESNSRYYTFILMVLSHLELVRGAF